MSTGSGLRPDGTGIIHYPSSNVCVNVALVKGNKQFFFYDSSGLLLARFTQGEGFIQWPSGVQRASITSKGGQICNDKGAPTESWSWEVHGRKSGPKRPIDFKMNNNLTFRCTSKSVIEVDLKLTGNKRTFHLGKKDSSEAETFSDKMVAMKKRGKLDNAMSEMLAHMPTLQDRYNLSAKDQSVEAVEQAQKRNWQLPQISASGREVKTFCKSLTRPGLDGVVGSMDNIVHTMKDFHTAVGSNVFLASTLQREAALQHQSTRKPKGSPFVCKAPEVGNSGQVYSAIVPRRPKAVPPLQPMSMKAIDKEIALSPPTQLVVVLCSTRHDENCKAAEKMMAGLNFKFMKEARAAAARLPKKPARAEAEAGDGEETEPTSEGKEQEKEDGPYVVPECRILLNDCARSNVARKRHDFTICPMYLMYYSGQLVYISSTFNGFERTEKAFLIQVEKCKQMGGRQQFLPADYSMNMSKKELSEIK